MGQVTQHEQASLGALARGGQGDLAILGQNLLSPTRSLHTLLCTPASHPPMVPLGQSMPHGLLFAPHT